MQTHAKPRSVNYCTQCTWSHLAGCRVLNFAIHCQPMLLGSDGCEHKTVTSACICYINCLLGIVFMCCRRIMIISIKPGSRQKVTSLHFKRAVSTEDDRLPIRTFLIAVISMKWCKMTICYGSKNQSTEQQMPLLQTPCCVLNTCLPAELCRRLAD